MTVMPGRTNPLLSQQSVRNSHLATYGIMLLGMLLLAWCEHRAYRKHTS